MAKKKQGIYEELNLSDYRNYESIPAAKKAWITIKAKQQGKDPKNKGTKGTKTARAATVRFALVTVGIGAAIAVPIALIGGKTVTKYRVASPDS